MSKRTLRLYAARLDAGRALYGRGGVDLITIEGLEASVCDLEALYGGENMDSVILRRAEKSKNKVVVAMSMIAATEFLIETKGWKALEVSIRGPQAVRGVRREGGKIVPPDPLRGLRQQASQAEDLLD